MWVKLFLFGGTIQTHSRNLSIEQMVSARNFELKYLNSQTKFKNLIKTKLFAEELLYSNF